jgi:hypothetical protein
MIKDCIPGENITIFTPVVLELLEAVPELRADSDLSTTNEGVTVLWLKWRTQGSLPLSIHLVPLRIALDKIHTQQTPAGF